MNVKAATALVITVASISACDTYTAQQYQSDPSNVIMLQQFSQQGVRASVGSVTTAEGVEARPTCRLAGPLDLGGGEDVASVVKRAIQAEFLAGNIYSPSGKPVNVTLTELDPDSFGGNWVIGMRVSGSKGSYNVKSTTKFSTSFSAVSACNNTANAFNRALGQAINQMISHPNFRAIL